MSDAIPGTTPSSDPAQLDEPLDAKLTPRQAAFVQEYLIDNNGLQAALRAGYAEYSSGSPAAGLLKNPNIIRAIEIARAQRASRTKMTQDSVLHEMSLLSHSCLEHYIITDDGQVTLAPGAPQGAMAAIQSIKKKTRVRTDRETHEVTKEYDVEIRLWDKPGTLKLMGRHTGLFPDRVEHTGKDGGPIETVTKVESVIVDAAVQKETNV